MFFQFTPDGSTTYDLTDYVDRMDFEPERATAVVQSGLFVPSSRVGNSWTMGYQLNTSGIVSAADLPGLRSVLSQILHQRAGWLQIETDRRIRAVLDSARFTEWEGGVPLLRVAMRWLTAGYAESISTNFGTFTSGVGWSVNNTGDLPAPLRFTVQFQNAQTGQKLLILGGVTPDGLSQLNFEWQGDVAAGDILTIDAGVYGLTVQKGGFDAVSGITLGYPPYGAVGSSNLTYSLVPTNVITSSSIEFRQRWRFF